MRCKVASHRILLSTNESVVKRNLPIPKFWEEELDQEVKKLLKNGITRPSSSSFASPIIPVRKKSGELRLCIDFRALNDITLKDNYPLPRLDELIDELGGCSVFSILDATSGYYQISIDESDKPKTAFRWKNGLYEFNRMPFGLCNAPATFQRTMDIIFKDINGQYVIPYLDDIIIFSRNLEEHKEHLNEIFKRLQAAGIILNKKKCKIAQQEIKILGVVISKGIVKPDPDKIVALNEYKKPSNIRELRAFLGLVNYCRGFIENTALITGPLNNLLKGENKKSTKIIEWNDELTLAFKQAKNTLHKNTMRYQPNFNEQFILTTDASDKAIGAILSQRDKEGNEKIVHYFSKILDETQKNYCITDKELLAVVKGIDKFRRYLLGKKFILKTDHQALTFMKEAKNTNSRILRWSLRLQEYDFEIQYIKGEENGADALSRYSTEKENDNKCNAILLNDEERNNVIKSYHITGGHASANNMKFLMKDKYTWPTLYKEIDKYVSQCKICLLSGNKLGNTLNKVIKPTQINHLWELDLIGRIEGKTGKNKFIFVAIDHFSKWLEAKVIDNKEAHTIISCITELILNKHGRPSVILTDNGLEFKNTECENLAKDNNFEWVYNSPDHHETVGAVERANQSLWRKIQKLSEYGRYKWESTVEKAVYAMNISHHRALGTSPYILQNRQHPRLPIDETTHCHIPQVDQPRLYDNIEKLRTRYDEEIKGGKRLIKRNIAVGDPVLIYRKALSDKLKEKWHSGFTVQKLIGDDAYQVVKGSTVYRMNKEYVKRDTSSS
ncbi:hypothetical protein ENBRE01_1973 [Enteropsectra breve]|nr:hypothetical protein ENBRE01_1973 [Enteropsectra breve]